MLSFLTLPRTSRFTMACTIASAVIAAGEW